MERVIQNNYKVKYLFQDLPHLADIIKNYVNFDKHCFSKLETKNRIVIWKKLFMINLE